ARRGGGFAPLRAWEGGGWRRWRFGASAGDSAGTRVEGGDGGGRHAHAARRRNTYLGCAVSRFGKGSGVLAAVADAAAGCHRRECRVADRQPPDSRSRSRVLSDR